MWIQLHEMQEHMEHVELLHGNQQQCPNNAPHSYPPSLWYATKQHPYVP